MACIGSLLFSVNEKGVDPAGYKKFVDYTIKSYNSSNDKVGTTFANSLYLTTSSVIGLILFVVWFVFVMITIILFYQGVINAITAVVIIVAFLVFVTIYFILATLYEKHFAHRIMPDFQSATEETVIYTFNSIIRDGLFVALCR
jgi:hypothetical protein